MIRTQRLLVTVCLILLIRPGFAQSIPDYQQIAAGNNPEVQAAFQRYLASLQVAPQVSALPDPEVAFGYFISPIETRVGPQQARISLTQMFPWFGSLSDNRAISEFRAQAQFEVFQETRNRIFFQTEKVITELYELDQSMRIARENLDILNSLVEISMRRYETDQASQVDVLRAQIEQEDLKIQIELLEDNRKVLLQKASELLYSDTPIEVPDTLISSNHVVDEDELRKRLLAQNPELNKLRYEQDAAKGAKSLAEKEGLPSFGLGVDYILTGERKDVAALPDNGTDALLARASFRIPLSRSKYNAKVEQAELNIRSVESGITDREQKLETELQAALRDQRDARRRYDLYENNQIQRIQQALTIMTQKYAADSSNFEEILRMQRKLLDYRLNRIRALADRQIASSYLDYLTGADNITPTEFK